VGTGISISGSHINFTYTPAALDVLKFTVTSPNLNRTARRLFKPTLVNLGPSYVTNTLAPLSFVDGWPTVVTADFDRALSLMPSVSVFDANGFTAGTVTATSFVGARITFTVTPTAAATRIRLVNFVDVPGNVNSSPVYISIVCNPPTAPTLTVMAAPVFTAAAPLTTRVSFSDPLSACTVSINAGGAVKTFLSGTNYCDVLVTAMAASTTLTFSVTDNVDGGTATLVQPIKVRPAISNFTINGVASTTFPYGAAKAAVVVFSEMLASAPTAALNVGSVAPVVTWPYLGNNDQASIMVTS
jgi:hypothetical protein